MSGHPQIYLTDFHKQNSENCLKDIEKVNYTHLKEGT